jgi:hypothetical protein
MTSVLLRRESTLGALKDANFPKDADGRVYHLSVRAGEGLFLFFVIVVISDC